MLLSPLRHHIRSRLVFSRPSSSRLYAGFHTSTALSMPENITKSEIDSKTVRLLSPHPLPRPLPSFLSLSVSPLLTA